MSSRASTDLDEKYLEILLARIRVCKTYQPKFGQGQRESGLSLREFQKLYGADPFYAWLGLDTPLVYAAHRAAGGITSVYRQIGMGSEELFRQILQDHLSLSEDQVTWSYVVRTGARSRTLSLDGCIRLADVQDAIKRDSLATWLGQSAAKLDVAPKVADALQGAVFEVRQGYKSKDSKRQQADLANAAAAYAQGYLPVLLVLSTQVDSDVAERYENEKWLVLRGEMTGLSTDTTYAFMKEVVGYDLAAFFERNADKLKAAILDVLETLLSSG